MTKRIMKCASYVHGGICADGFPTKPYCRGEAGCWSCGHISEPTLPMCLTEQYVPHLMNEDGSMRLFGKLAQ